MSGLRASDFAAFFEALHERPPFPWQSRLVEQVAAEGRWPAAIAIPTGLGKTAALDAATFLLALDPQRSPRRVVLVVDRRTVVDQAARRADLIAKRLREARDGVLGELAARLRDLTEDGDPVATAVLRGGIARDDAWARRPDQPLLATSTVDQVGSRLLFRGYGVSASMRPIHAGLLGHDTLILLDEVHLSQPFLETLRALERYRSWRERELPDRWQVVEMTATPRSNAARFALDAADIANDVVQRRVHAKRRLRLVEPVKTRGTPVERTAGFAAALAAEVPARLAPGGAVGVVVNRVATAHATADALRASLAGRADVILVTGRMRPLDRDDRDTELAARAGAGRKVDASAKPLVVVATQCIEAGADLDFDALVTECASLDALRQRLGRLNRLGERDDAECVVLVRAEALKESDPVYGDALARTWEHLSKHAAAIARGEPIPDPAKLADHLAPEAHAPVLLPAHLDAWAQTSDVPRPDPDVALWLHGPSDGAPEVQIAWRADLTPELLAAALGDGPDAQRAGAAALARVAVCPPSSLETVAVPLWAARAWLAGEEAEQLADVEGRAPAEAEGKRREPKRRAALVWRGDASRVDVDFGPGDTLVVPSAYGGLRDGNWSPDPSAAPEPVADLGLLAAWRHRRRVILRCVPGALGASHGADGELPAWVYALPAPSRGEEEDDDGSSPTARLEALADRDDLPDVLALALRTLRGAGVLVRPSIEVVPGWGEPGAPGSVADLLALSWRCRYPKAVPTDEQGSGPTTEDDSASHTGVEVKLREHLGGVGAWAKRFARVLAEDAPQGVAHDVELAGLWHDAGKADPRFQRMLHGGSELRAMTAPEPLAKSKVRPRDRQLAQERSGYPKGTRHELASVALMEKAPDLLGRANDRDLVLHLVASHHGWCRPFAPIAPDPEPVDVTFEAEGETVTVRSDHGLARLDSGIAERFWRLVERYGWHGLAYLEALLRLADHRRSEQEQEEGGA